MPLLGTELYLSVICLVSITVKDGYLTLLLSLRFEVYHQNLILPPMNDMHFHKEKKCLDTNLPNVSKRGKLCLWLGQLAWFLL